LILGLSRRVQYGFSRVGQAAYPNFVEGQSTSAASKQRSPAILQDVKIIEQTDRARQSGFMGIQTDAVIQGAQLKATLASPFASAEQKMMARIDLETLQKQTEVQTRFNNLRNQMVATGETVTDHAGIADIKKEHQEREETELQAARQRYVAMRQQQHRNSEEWQSYVDKTWAKVADNEERWGHDPERINQAHQNIARVFGHEQRRIGLSAEEEFDGSQAHLWYQAQAGCVNN